MAKIFGLGGQYTILNQQIGIDTLLIFIGGINKMVDLILGSSLGMIASSLLTWWMTGSEKSGVSLLDFELMDELLSPLVAIKNVIRRVHSQKRSAVGWRGTVRYFVSFVIAVCVWFMPIAVNTLAIPKLRWYPLNQDGWAVTASIKADSTLQSPRMILETVDWINFWQVGFDAVNGGEPSWVSQLAFETAQTFSAFSDFSATYSQRPVGWWPAHRDADSVTAINTRPDVPFVESASVRTLDIGALYDFSKQNEQRFRRHSSQFYGAVNLTSPAINTVCFPATTNIVSEILSFSPLNNSQPLSSSLLNFGALPALDFSAISCDFHVRQATFPVDTWSLDCWDPSAQISTDYAIVVDSVRVNRTRQLYYHDDSGPDHYNTQLLKSQLNIMLPVFNQLSAFAFNGYNQSAASSNFLQTMILSARNLRNLNPDFESDAQGLSHVVAFFAQYLLTIADWNLTASTTERVTSYPVWWRVYSSGPRLGWEQAIVVVPSIVLVALVAGVAMMFYVGKKPLACLEVGQMLLAARDSAPHMTTFGRTCVGEIDDEAKEAKFWVRLDGNDPVLTDDPTLKRLKPRTDYCV